MPSFRTILLVAVALAFEVFGQSVHSEEVRNDSQFRYGVLITATTEENHVTVWRWERGEYCALQELVIPELLHHSLSSDPGVGSLALDQSQIPVIINKMIKIR